VANSAEGDWTRGDSRVIPVVPRRVTSLASAKSSQ